MEKVNKFLTKGTKIFSIVTSVLVGIALLSLVIIGLIGGSFLDISLIGSCVVVFVICIFLGSIQIRVFSDYKSQKKYLCADGIFNICLTILVAISALVFVFVPKSNFDIRYFIFVFAIAFAAWKVLITISGFKNKRFNSFAELLIALFWAISGIAVLLSALNVNFATYILCASNYILCAVTIFYILYSYVFREPAFLETPEAVAILEKEMQEREQRINRFNNRYNAAQVAVDSKPEKTDSIEDKLNKLQSLKERKFITEEEFEKRRQKLLDEEL